MDLMKLTAPTAASPALWRGLCSLAAAYTGAPWGALKSMPRCLFDQLLPDARYESLWEYWLPTGEEPPVKMDLMKLTAPTAASPALWRGLCSLRYCAAEAAFLPIPPQNWFASRFFRPPRMSP